MGAVLRFTKPAGTRQLFAFCAATALGALAGHPFDPVVLVLLGPLVAFAAIGLLPASEGTRWAAVAVSCAALAAFTVPDRGPRSASPKDRRRPFPLPVGETRWCCWPGHGPPPRSLRRPPRAFPSCGSMGRSRIRGVCPTSVADAWTHRTPARLWRTALPPRGRRRGRRQRAVARALRRGASGFVPPRRCAAGAASIALQAEGRRPVIGTLPPFVRFAITGAAGFVVDIAVPLGGHALGRTVALCRARGLLSGGRHLHLGGQRHLTFGERRARDGIGMAREWLTFLTVNLGGMSVNYALFAVLVAWAPATLSNPFIAAGGGLDRWALCELRGVEPLRLPALRPGTGACGPPAVRARTDRHACQETRRGHQRRSRRSPPRAHARSLGSGGARQGPWPVLLRSGRRARCRARARDRQRHGQERACRRQDPPRPSPPPGVPRSSCIRRRRAMATSA